MRNIMWESNKLVSIISGAIILYLVLFTPRLLFGQKEKIISEFSDHTQSKQTSLSDSLDYYGDLRDITKFKYEIAKEKYFEKQYSGYFTENLNHRKNTFNWQLFSTKLIFLTVIVIVFCGLVFSGIQFYQTIKQTNALSKLANSENLQNLEKLTHTEKTEIELSLTNGIKITSSIIGLIILTISIVFFYLYILHVYPINQINIDNSIFNKTEMENTMPPNDVQKSKSTGS